MFPRTGGTAFFSCQAQELIPQSAGVAEKSFSLMTASYTRESSNVSDHIPKTSRYRVHGYWTAEKNSNWYT